MYAIAPVPASPAADSVPPPVEFPVRTGSATVGPSSAPVPLDPRPAHVLSTQASDAILTLSTKYSPSVSAGSPPAVASSPTRAPNAVPSTGSGDAGAAGTPLRPTPEPGAGQTPSPSKPVGDSRFHDRSGVAATKDDASGVPHINADDIDAISFYLMSNSINYESFKQQNPGVNLYWINVDNEKIVSLWPRKTVDHF